MTKQPAAFYLRRSAIDESGDDTSITYQRRACEAIAKQHGLEIVNEFNEGSGRSASIFTENARPQSDRAGAGLGTEYKVRVSYAIDRLTRRGMGAVGYLLDQAKARGGRVITNDGLDTSHSSARLVGSFMGEMAYAEMQKLSERVCASKQEGRLRGEYLGGSVPYGLMAKRAVGEKTVLIVDLDAAPVIVEMVQRLIDGATLGETCHWANGAGHRRSNGAAWIPSTLHKLVRSSHLIGHRKQASGVYCSDDGQPVVVPDPIITEAQFARVDRVLMSRRSAPSNAANPRTGLRRPSTSLIGGLLRCSECAEPMWFGRVGPKGRTHSYYSCRQCSPRHAVRSDLLEPHISRMALMFVASLEPGSAIMEEVGRRMLARFSSEQVNRRQTIEDEVETIDGRMRKFRRENLADQLDDVEYGDLLNTSTTRRNTLLTELHTLPEAEADLGILFDLAGCSDDPDADFVGEGSAWFALEHHKKREILRVLVDSVVVERRPKPSEDIEGRTFIEFAEESNVIQLAARPTNRSRYSKRAKVA